MFNPYMQGTPQNAFSAQFQPPCQITRVNGENGARAYQMPTSSSVLLLDESQPLVWLKITDGAGYPTLTPYKIEPYKPQAEPDVRQLEERLKKLEDYFNGKSNSFPNDGQQRQFNDSGAVYGKADAAGQNA